MPTGCGRSSKEGAGRLPLAIDSHPPSVADRRPALGARLLDRRRQKSAGLRASTRSWRRPRSRGANRTKPASSGTPSAISAPAARPASARSPWVGGTRVRRASPQLGRTTRSGHPRSCPSCSIGCRMGARPRRWSAGCCRVAIGRGITEMDPAARRRRPARSAWQRVSKEPAPVPSNAPPGSRNFASKSRSALSRAHVVARDESALARRIGTSG